MLNKEEIECVLRNPHLYSFNEDGDEKETEKILLADIRLMSVDELLRFLNCIEIKVCPEVKMEEKEKERILAKDDGRNGMVRTGNMRIEREKRAEKRAEERRKKVEERRAHTIKTAKKMRKEVLAMLVPVESELVERGYDKLVQRIHGLEGEQTTALEIADMVTEFEDVLDKEKLVEKHREELKKCLEEVGGGF